MRPKVVHDLSEIPRFSSQADEERWWRTHELSNDCLNRMLRRHDPPKSCWAAFVVLACCLFVVLTLVTVFGKAVGLL